MTVKKTLRARATTSIRSHPAIAWGTLAAIISIVGVVAPGCYFIWKLIETVDHASQTFETKVDSDAKFKEALNQVAIVRGELRDLRAEFKVVQRNASWLFVGQSRQEATVARNRVNDCNIKREKRLPMSDLEQNACSQYLQEFEDAKRRFADAQATANAASR